MPPLNSLRAFEAAARHKSFKVAAAELCVTPTAISHQIKHLEDIVGARLFDRAGRVIELTEAGQRFFPVLRDGFDRIAQAVVDLQRQGETITISVTSAFAAKILVPNLYAFQALHPGVRLHVDASEALVDLRKAEADLAVRYALDRPSSMRIETLFSDHYIAVAAPSLLRTPSITMSAAEISSAQLLGYPWRNLNLQGPAWPEWMDLAGMKDFDVTRCHVFSEESHAIQAAIDGLGVGLLSSALVAHDLAVGRLVRVHPLTLPGFTFRAVFLDNHPKMESILKIVHWLAGLAGEMHVKHPNSEPRRDQP